MFLALLVLALLLGRPLRPAATFGAALFCGGGLSNLFDRMSAQGNVVDFIKINIGPLRPYIFNPADAAIVVGAAICLVCVLIRLSGGFFSRGS